MASEHGGSILRWLVALALLGGGVGAGIRYWGRTMDAGVEFSAVPVNRGDITQSVIANGSLNPVRMIEVGSQISGVLTEIKVDFNSLVKAGEIVAQIDPATYERALSQAEAELANAEAALELAELNYERAWSLHTNSLISKSEFDQQRVNLSQAKAVVRTRKANVDRASVDLNRTTIYAPIDGVVITRRVEAGQTVAASMNAPTLFVIANDLAKMQIEAAVSEADVGGLEEGQSVQFTVDAFPGRSFRGTVQQVRFGATTNQNVVTYTTVVAVDNKDLKLRPGMTANARFITAERKGVLKIPNAAARFLPPPDVIVRGDTNALAAAAGGDGFGGGGGSGGFASGVGDGGGGAGGWRDAASEDPKSGTVYLVEKEASPSGREQTVLRAVTVRLGIGDSTGIEVLEGLNEGDMVVTGLALSTAADSAAAQSTLRGPFGGPTRH